MTRHDEHDLDPMNHPERWERLVGGIVLAGEPYLAERRAPPKVTTVVAGWARPSLAAAATVMLLLTAAVGITGGNADETDTQLTFAQSLVPETYAAWLEVDYEPTVTELVTALEEGAR